MDLSKIYSLYQTCPVTFQVNASLFRAILTNKLYDRREKADGTGYKNISFWQQGIQFVFHNNLTIWYGV